MRSEVQVFPGPPAFAAVQLRLGRPFLNEGCCAVAPAKASAKAFVFWYGAIAQLGERVLCKHEVVGSIPTGSTSLRWLRQLRLGEPDRSEGCYVVAPGAKTGRLPTQVYRPRNITSLALSGWIATCVISDIVKRRSIRVWDLQASFAESHS